MLKLALQKRYCSTNATNKIPANERLRLTAQSAGSNYNYNDDLTRNEQEIRDNEKPKKQPKANNNDLITSSQKEKVSKVEKASGKAAGLSVQNIVSSFSANMKHDKFASLIHDPNVKLQNIGDTNFPRNTPCYICGPKGSGKTYMLSALLQYVVANEYMSRIFYVYADNVDATIHSAIPKNKLYLISKDQAEPFLSKYLKKKTKFCSWMRFIKTAQSLGVGSMLGMNLDELMGTKIYWDNLIDETVKKKGFDSFDELLEYARHTVQKYTKSNVIKLPNNNESRDTGFKVGLGGTDASGMVKINVGPFGTDDFDMFVFDDIAQFFDLWGNTRGKSKLYKYFTITRQNRTTFYLCGQELLQLQKMFREQLGALVALNGTDLQELKTYKFNKKMITTIEDEFKKLGEHEGFLYNYNTQTLEIIKNQDGNGKKKEVSKDVGDTEKATDVKA